MEGPITRTMPYAAASLRCYFKAAMLLSFASGMEQAPTSPVGKAARDRITVYELIATTLSTQTTPLEHTMDPREHFGE